MNFESLPDFAAAPEAALPTRRARALILAALTIGGFAIGTSEFASMGLMPTMVADLHVDEPHVGHLISAYACGVVVGAPLLALLGGKLKRKTLLLALMAFYALGNLATALGPNYHALLLCRFIAGLPHGAYFGVAALVAAGISEPHERGQSVSLMMFGLNFAMLLGNPVSAWLGQQISWRIAFFMVSALAVLTVCLIARFLPVDAVATPQVKVRDELRAFNRLPVWQALLLGVVGFAGFFAVFAYLAPTLLYVTHVSKAWIPFGLSALGLGSMIGNFVGGWLFDRLGFRGIAVVLAWSIVTMLAFTLAARSPLTVLPATVAVGLLAALGTLVQTHLMDVAGEAQTLAAASHHAAFNAANALGPLLGGLAIEAGFGWTSTGYVGAVTASLGLLLYAWARRSMLRREFPSTPAA